MWFNCDPPNPTRILYQNDVAVTWQGVTPVYGGLVNLNNSCFLNASVQALMHLPGFVKFLAEDIAHRKGCFTLLNCVVCALNRTHLNMSLHAAFRPIGLLNLLPKLSPLLKRGRQEDADEFIVALLDKVTEELILREGGPANVDFCSRQTTAVGQIFGWWSRTEGKCGDCSTSTLTYAPQTSLSLPLDDSVQSAINVRLKEVEIVEDFTCIRKCLKRVAFQTVDFYSYPKVLRIVLNRFDNDSYKRSQPVSVEKSIVIGDATYSFVSCVLHDGNTATEGHYTCLATRHDGKLVFINDAEISEAKGLFGLNSPKCKREVYVLFYQFHHMKVHSIKRALAKTPSNALSPLRKKIHSSPMKRSLEKRGKKLTFSPKKFKRKVGSLMHSILPSKPKLFKGDDILAKPLPEKKESWIMKLACNRGMSDEEELGTTEAAVKEGKTVAPIVVQRRRKLVPPSTSSQSSNDYRVIEKGDEEKSETTETAVVTPIKILKRPAGTSSHPPDQRSIITEGDEDKQSDTTMTATLTPIKLQLKQSESTSRTAAFNFSEECPDSQAGNSICTEPEMLTGSPEPGNMWRTQELKNLFGSEYGNSDQHKKPLQSLRNSAKEKNQLEAEVDTCHHADIPYVCSDIPSTDSDNQDCHNNACASENLGEYVSLHNVPKFMLPNDKLEKNTVVQLQNYLKSRKILPVPRLKADLIAKVKEVMALEPAPVSKPNVCNKKQQRLVLTKDVAQLPDDDVFPPTGWEVFPSRDMPSNFNFGSVFNYIVETMPQLPDPASNTPLADSSDEEDIAENVVIINDPFEDAEQTEIKCSKKLRRGLQYVKSKYVRNVHDCLPDRLHCYKGQVRASMSKVAYHVKVAIFQVSGSVVKASCHCGAHTMQRCSHISALLLYLLLHKNLNGPKAITCTSLPNVWNVGSLQRQPGFSKSRQYDSVKRDFLRRATFDPRPAIELEGRTSHMNFMYLLSQLSYKKEPSLFQQLGSLTYEDFAYDESDREIIRTNVGLLFTALEEQVNNLKPSPAFTGPFELAGTRGQSSTDLWSRVRSLQCSAQPSRRINRFKTESARTNFLRHHLWGIGNITTKAMKYGKKHESTARRKYQEEQQLIDPSVVVEESGMFLHTQHIGLSCSPDGLRKSQNDPCRLVEIKVLYSLRDHDPAEFDTHLTAEKLSNFCLERNSTGEAQLKKNHAYYDQVQFCMGLLQLQACDFVVWTPQNMMTFHIPFNEERWLELRKSSLEFHKEYLLPEYFAKRTPRKLCPIRLE